MCVGSINILLVQPNPKEKINKTNCFKTKTSIIHENREKLPPEVEFVRGGEGGAGYLLGVKAQGADERAVLALRQGSSDRLRREVVSEAQLVH